MFLRSDYTKKKKKKKKTQRESSTAKYGDKPGVVSWLC